jgi:protease-4
MKGFFSHVLASMLGTFLVLILIMLINLLILLTMLSSSGAFSDKENDISDNAVLHLNFETPIADQSSAQPNLSTFSLDKTVSLRSFTKTIEKAKDDKRIKGIFLDLSFVQVGIASVEEIRRSLLDFKSSGKFIIAHADMYSHKSYYLATVADKIYMTPEGMIQFTGLSAQVMFFKSMLDKIGIEPEIIRHGKFKSAVEPFMQDEISEANKEQTLKYTSSLWNTMLKGIEKQRKISVAELNLIADSLKLQDSKSAKALKFVDELKYKDQVLDELKALSGTKNEDKLDLASLIKYMKNDQDFDDIMHPSDNLIALIYAEGSIVEGKGSDGQIGSESLSEAIREAREDKNVKAVVLRINSPGGSSLASEVIWRETVLTQKVKPLIVSMGDVAASGGYYIACAADTIVAEPNTITGSIGVFGLLFNAKELMKDIGVNVHSVNTNQYSDFGSPMRKMTEFEKSVIQNIVEGVYQTFITHVSEGRKLPVEKVDEIGQGRVWSGEDAMAIGLVDRMGGLQTAMDIAVRMAGLKEYSVKTYPEKDKFAIIIESIIGEAKSAFIRGELGESYTYYKRLQELKKMDGIQARIPYFLDIE